MNTLHRTPTRADASTITTRDVPKCRSASVSERQSKLTEGKCAACHGTGVNGAPKVGDKAPWAPRIAQGKDTLYKDAIQGKGAMPPKGGSNASDADVKAAVDYMVAAAK